MKKYKAYHGLGGRLGGAREYNIIEAENESQALEIAYKMAVEDYQSYEGMYKLETFYDVVNNYNNENPNDKLNPNVDEEHNILEKIYLDKISRWLDYWVELEN